jgi:hypothetical protein
MILVPYVELNGSRTISDQELKHIFAQIKREGTLSTVFTDGKISTEEEFVDTVKEPTNHFVFILIDGKIRGFAWLNSCSDNHAFGHFCFLKEVWGATDEIGKEVLKYWFSFPGPDGPLFELILGLIPKFNQRAQKFIERLGFVRVGEIPSITRKGADRVPSILSYVLRTQL